MNRLNAHLRAKHGLKQPFDLTLEDWSWYALGAVAALFFAVFFATQLYAKVAKPQPAAHMSTSLTTPCPGDEFRVAQRTLAQCEQQVAR